MSQFDVVQLLRNDIIKMLQHDVVQCLRNDVIREWSLITGRGGLQNGRGGHVKFYPYEKGGAEKVLAILKGGGTKCFGVDFTR